MVDHSVYEGIRSGGPGFYEQPRGLIAIWGKEAVKFLDGMITNDMKTLEDGAQMLAAFPNAQGRLLAVVRILRQGEKYFIETEQATREKLFQNLFRFTFAGDFFAEDLSEQYRYFDTSNVDSPRSEGALEFALTRSTGRFVPVDEAEQFGDGLVALPDDVYETIRIENGIPKYGVDMDETTIVPELGLDGLISYNKGCYIGQEIIARIHFRGHVAKRLSGLIFAEEVPAGSDLTTLDGKNAGRVTSTTFSPAVGSHVGLGYVRYDYLPAGTQLLCGDVPVTVAELPIATVGN